MTVSGPVRRRLRDTLTGWFMLASGLVSAAAHDRPAFARADRDGDGRVALPEAVGAGIPRIEALREGARDGRGLPPRAWW